MEFLDSFKFIADTNLNYNINYICEIESSLYKPYILKRKYLRFNIFSVIQWYFLLRFLYKNSIKIPDQYTNYKTFYDDLNDAYICLSKNKNLDEIDNFITRLHKKEHLKIDIVNERPELIHEYNSVTLVFDSSINYLKVDGEYMTIGLLFNKFMDSCDNQYFNILCDENFISEYIDDDNDCRDFIYVNNDNDNVKKSKIWLYIKGLSYVIKNIHEIYDLYNDKILINISMDAYINTLIEEYSNHILTHNPNPISNTMSKHIVYTDDTDVIKQVLINNSKIIRKIQSIMHATLGPDDSYLQRKQDLLDTLKSSKAVNNKSDRTKITL